MRSKHLLLALVAQMFSLTAWAQVAIVEIDGFNYSLNSNTRTASVIKNDSGYSGDVTIPNEVMYDGVTYSVTSVGESVFYNCTGLKSITIPESVTSVGKGAFRGCEYLNAVYILDIAAWCNIRFSDSTSNPLTYSHHLFLNGKEIKDLMIPEGLTSVGNYAFIGCSELTSVTIPNSVTSIGDCAFWGCYRLTTIYCLNPTPPTTYSTATFCCTTEYVRNAYDVYTYATLHVPMGSAETYSSAYEWRYFNKIKEDMESNGKVYYANLTVKQGETGYTRQAIKVEETYKIYIGSLGDNKVNAVTFNGTDVTNEVFDGYYTTPQIKGESVLSISYEISPTSVGSTSLEDVRVTGHDGEIRISNIDKPSQVCLYSLDGKLLDTMPSAFGNVRLSAPSEQVYVVKVGARTYKIAM